MRCYCGHFFRQMGGSTAPTVPNSKRLVILEECGGVRQHVGWFDAPSGHWLALDQERQNGNPMPSGEWCSITIGNITAWREILQHNV